jgi:hypothetical protein
MATVQKEILTRARVEDVWNAIRDIGALHTRLVPGFVVATKLEPGARIVTFGSGMTVREPIVTIDEERKRLVWSAQGGRATHYNSSARAETDADGGSKVIWISDFLPDSIAPDIDAAMTAGATVMKQTLDRLAGQA